MLTYPKIETLYDRKDNFSVDTTRVRVPAFENIRTWVVTEKIDGMNVRVGLHADGSVEYNGRTDNAQLPSTLVAYLRRTFTEEVMRGAFPPDEAGQYPEVVLFGEGYGPGIQKGGTYRADVAVRLFDVNVGGWWLEGPDVFDIATKVGVSMVPVMGQFIILPGEADMKAWLGLGGGESNTALADSGQTRQAEGIVARAYPMLLTRRGDRCMWKLKFSDFREGKR